MGLSDRLATSVTDIRNRGRRLVQLNVELLASEAKEKGRQSGAAAGLFVGAAVLALYAFGFALATIAVALALVLPLWLSLLIVTAVLVVIVTILALVGRSKMEQAKQPTPERALVEARRTAELMKANLRQTAAGVRAKVASRRASASADMTQRAPGQVAQLPGQADQPSDTPPSAGA